jgi:chromate reductase
MLTTKSAGSPAPRARSTAWRRRRRRLRCRGGTLESELPDLPGFNQDNEKSPPAAVTELKAKIHAADAILIVTPEYNYSVPGVLKNAIDWASRPYGDSAWKGKPVAVMGASVGALAGAGAVSPAPVFVFSTVCRQPA